MGKCRMVDNQQDKPEAAYFRTDLFDKRRAMMEEWAVYACAAKQAGNEQTSGP